MSDRGVGWGYEGWEVGGDGRVHMGECSPAIGRITQLTDRVSVQVTRFRPLEFTSILPSGRIVEIWPLYMLYVYRQSGQAGMIVNRVDPFQYEQMYLTDLEMETVMAWAFKMNADGIGRFSPVDGGWMWWRK